MAKEKFLYFAESGGADAEAEAVVVPVSSIMGIHPTAATTCNIYWKETRFVENAAAGTAEARHYAELTYTSGAFKAVVTEIMREIGNPDSNAPALIVVADGDNSVFLHNDITAAIVTLSDDDVNPDN